jgi:hypothetical protein
MDVEGRGDGIIYGTIPEFARGTEEHDKPRSGQLI